MRDPHLQIIPYFGSDCGPCCMHLQQVAAKKGEQASEHCYQLHACRWGREGWARVLGSTPDMLASTAIVVHKVTYAAQHKGWWRVLSIQSREKLEDNVWLNHILLPSPLLRMHSTLFTAFMTKPQLTHFRIFCVVNTFVIWSGAVLASFSEDWSRRLIWGHFRCVTIWRVTYVKWALQMPTFLSQSMQDTVTYSLGTTNLLRKL